MVPAIIHEVSFTRTAGKDEFLLQSYFENDACFQPKHFRSAKTLCGCSINSEKLCNTHS